MTNKFQKGDVVVLKEDVKWSRWQDDGFEPLPVLDVTADGDLVIETIDWNNRTSKKVFEADSVMLESEALQKMSDLEQEFQKTQAAVSVKIKEMDLLFAEAVKLASDNGFTVRDLGVGPNVRAMIRSGGWSASSFSC